MSRDFDRPKEGFRFLPGGLKTNSVADLLTPDKYPLATNVRWTLDGSIRTRPGQALKFATGGQPITDIGVYAKLLTDDLPRYLARDTQDRIWLDNGVQVGSLAAGNLGAMFIPFRPAQSPESWLFVANGADYQKFSAPVANAVTQRRVGIQEPCFNQNTPGTPCAPGIASEPIYYLEQDVAPASWTAGGTAGAISGTVRTTDTLVVSIVDPDSHPQSGSASRNSIQVHSTQQYQVGQLIDVVLTPGPVHTAVVVQDVITPFSGSAFTINGIQYYSNSGTGRCQIALKSYFAEGLSDPRTTKNFLTAIRRGAIMTFSGGAAETTIVLSYSVGPDDSISIEAVTNSAHAAGEHITFQPTIIADVQTGLAGNTIQDPGAGAFTAVTSTIAAGTGTLTQATAFGFVNNPLQVTASNGSVVGTNSWLKPDDYFHISLNFSDLTKLATTGPAVRIVIDVGDGSFTQNYYYYDVQANDLTSAVAGTQTQLGAAQIQTQQQITRQDLSNLGGFGAEIPVDSNMPGPPDQNPTDQVTFDFGASSTQTTLGATQWSEIFVPVRSFTRVGNDQTKNLLNAVKLQVQITVTASVTAQVHSLWFGGGGLPDVGQAGSPYLYRVRFRDSRTGARGNPGPATRFGVSPRRQLVNVTTPRFQVDPQIDTCDIFRWGGTVTSWRYVGSIAVDGNFGASFTFYDNVFDDAAQAGELLEFDNFEPWPSVDVPQNLTATQITGTLIKVNIPSPTNALRWLPGTLIQIFGTRAAYTLRNRPNIITGTTYILEVEEAAAFNNGAPTLSIPEPVLANQKLPYIWGPDAQGTIFGTGDPLRPGVVYFSKPFAPDMCPDSFNQELTGPSEPLLGGEIIDGLSYVGSSDRQWALYSQFSDPINRYNPIQQAEPRGIAAPYGHCNDGQKAYYWAKDGIRATGAGSLTDADLYNLFPHDGVAGGTIAAQAVTYFGQTIQPPDYSRAGTFRLAIVNYYLYAIYQDSSGTYRCLTLDTRRGSWSVDAFTPAVSAIARPLQQAGSLITSVARYDEVVMGNISGQASTEADLSNDLGGSITSTLATFEFDGGDVRAPVQWGDLFIDLVAAASAGVVVTPVSLGAQVVPPITIPTLASRQRTPVSVGGIFVSDFMGLVFQWTDNYSVQSAPTQLHLWQPSFDVQPARDIAFFTFGTSFDMRGFIYIPEMTIAYVSTQPVTITPSVVDGTAPAPIVLPSSGGVYTKKFVRPTFNKGRLYNFAVTSPATFQIFEDDSEILVGQWGRSDGCQLVRSFGERTTESAPI